MSATLVIASHNAGKLREFQALLANEKMTIRSAADFQVEEPEETGLTFAANAQLKALHCAGATGLPSLADDSGLSIPALDGAPGIYSARWAGPSKDFSVAFARIQKELAEKNASAPIAAAFECVLSLADKGTTKEFYGRVDGTLTFPPQGSHGFGYDPIFIPKGHHVTFAQMDTNIKNSISHRTDALTKFLAYIRQHPI